MSTSTTLSIEDAQAIVRMIGRVAGMTDSLDVRRRELIEALAQFVGADIWVWVHSRVEPATNDISGYSLMDGGYLDEAERGRMLTFANDPEVSATTLLTISPGRHSTFTEQDVARVYPSDKFASYRRRHQAEGFQSYILSLYPLGNGEISGIGLHRRIGRESFTERERFLTHLVLSQIEWLHRQQAEAPADDAVLFELTQRQRAVLLMLLSGEGPKQIAHTLGISLHTVRDHIKAIYRKFDVNDRGELLSQFIASGRKV